MAVRLEGMLRPGERVAGRNHAPRAYGPHSSIGEGLMRKSGQAIRNPGGVRRQNAAARPARDDRHGAGGHGA